jgi:formylglycine-generating enzyme required for sulfatase activity
MRVLGLATLLLAAREPDDEAKLLKIFREEFVALAPGEKDFPASFEMGSAKGEKSEGPVHKVTLTYPFQVGRYEVPQNLWEAVMGQNPSRWKGARNSVEMISFDDAVAFCTKATDLMRAAKLIEADQVVRLPSEAEWEYAARAGSTTKYSYGDDPKELDAYAWHTGNAAGNDPAVGEKKPNPWKLYDVHGYLWEWCADVWHDSYEGAPSDGSAWTTGGVAKHRVIRGGSWKDVAEKLTSTYRCSAAHDSRDDSIGLRCVLAKEKKSP